MRTQLLILGAAFIVFGLVAFLTQGWSPAYLGLLIFGAGALALSRVAPK